MCVWRESTIALGPPSASKTTGVASRTRSAHGVEVGSQQELARAASSDLVQPPVESAPCARTVQDETTLSTQQGHACLWHARGRANQLPTTTHCPVLAALSVRERRGGLCRDELTPMLRACKRSAIARAIRRRPPNLSHSQLPSGQIGDSLTRGALAPSDAPASGTGQMMHLYHTLGAGGTTMIGQAQRRFCDPRRAAIGALTHNSADQPSGIVLSAQVRDRRKVRDGHVRRMTTLSPRGLPGAVTQRSSTHVPHGMHQTAHRPGGGAALPYDTARAIRIVGQPR